MDESELNRVAKEYGYELTPAEPRELPRPTIWPITFAFGLIFLVWGFLTSLIISGVALIVVITGLAGWIQEFKS